MECCTQGGTGVVLDANVVLELQKVCVGIFL